METSTQSPAQFPLSSSADDSDDSDDNMMLMNH